MPRLSWLAKKIDAIERRLDPVAPWARPYVLALSGLIAACAIALVLLHTVGEKAAPIVSLVADLVFLWAAWLGYGPGILIYLLIVFVVPPIILPGRPNHVDLGRVGLLMVMSLLISRAGQSKRHSEALLRHWNRDLEARVEERTAEVERSEKRYRLLFENNPEAMWVYDPETLAFLAVNDTAVQRYGYSREEFMRMTLKDIRPAEDIQKLLDATTVRPPGLRHRGPWRHVNKNGQIISVEITAHQLEFEGRPACLVMATDITERLRLEEQFRQAQRLESIGLLAGGVAHDFNNLLTVINGYVEMTLAMLPPKSQIAEPLQEIGNAGERAAELTRQLLAFSRKQMMNLEVLDINKIVRETENFLGRLIGENISLRTKLSEDLGFVEADRGQIQQIIMNLAVNSRDAMPNGGILLIETANITLDEPYQADHPLVQPGPYVMLALTDTGTGMTPEVRARIFEPFYTTKEVGKGTGLGLATVYGIVKQSGGWIWVYSEPGKGTTFKIYLPRTDKVSALAAKPSIGDIRGEETVLIVEDQAEVRTMAVAGLARFGYSVHGFATGRDAITFCREFTGEIHLLVTDVLMEDMNGRQVADEVERIRPATRVLFMSGYTDNLIAHHGVLDEGVAYLQKPFTPETLARKVREVLRQNSAG